MAEQKDLDSTYMGVALLHSRLSKAIRSSVGACLVTNQGVCIPGYNGTPVGLPNKCEDRLLKEATECGAIYELVTKPEVIHAELNCILKAAKEGISCLGSTVYVTLSPCVPCAAMLINAGVRKVIYKDVYRSVKGLDLLEDAGIIVEQFKE